MSLIQVVTVLAIATWNDPTPPFKEHSFEADVSVEMCEWWKGVWSQWAHLERNNPNWENYRIRCVDPATAPHPRYPPG